MLLLIDACYCKATLRFWRNRDFLSKLSNGFDAIRLIITSVFNFISIEALIVGAESHEPTCDLGNEITFYGQSGVTDIAGGKHTNENLVNTTSDDHAATTTFVDALAVVSSTVAVPKPMSTLEIRDQYISDFLNKPKLLANVSWTTANTEGTVIYSLNEVGTLLNNVT